MDYKHLLFGFNGRINRAKFWIGIAIIVAIEVVAVVIAGMAGFMSYGAGSGAAAALSVPMWLVIAAAVIVILWISIAIGIKRLHDRSKSGWWLLLFWLVPGALQGGAMGMGQEGAGLIPMLAGAAISIWGFVEIGCLRGTEGPNAYGPDPLPAQS